MSSTRHTVLLGLAACALTLAACAGGCNRRASTCEVAGHDTPPAAWQAVCDEMDTIRQPREVSIQVGDAEGVLFTYTRGGASPEDYHEIASASKWMASAAIMRLVARGELSLEDHPQQYIDWWTDDPGDARSRITLGQLLSFTSGFAGAPGDVKCVNRTRYTTEECGEILYEDFFEYEPGSTFHYGPIHQHVAAMMAEGATGKDWNDIFADEVVTPLGLDESTVYTIAGEDNPRVAGGISTTGADYAKFLRAQLAGEYLADALDVMSEDHTPSPQVEIAHTPLGAADRDWHYGYGLWRECPAETFTDACAEHVRISSPGAYGFYPWIDRRHAYWAVMSTRRSLFVGAAADSVLAGERLQPLIAQALASEREGGEE